MRRRRLGFGAELAPLVLILACLAGSLGLIVAAYRRVNQTRTLAPRTPIVAAAPAPVPTPPRPVAPRVATPPPRLVVVDVPPPPPPEDPTPKALAQLTASEAEQLLAASQANRKAQALDEARQVAAVESERWRRRQSLIHAQVSTLETKVRKVETDLDALAFERDALEKELDARKAAVARAKSRPSQAILPHKGPNGTWRRPVIVECRNGAAVIQPQGMEFGLLDLESGFGATLNPFVAAVAREAIRVQRSASPDGAPVVPYIFFLVRPDGIRPYYEARGRLEPLGITFGYELADAEWEIEFPDLDDVAAWDGSASSGGPNPALASNPPGRGPKSSAEDTDLPTWPGPRGNGKGNGPIGDPSRPFTFGGGGNSRSTSIMGRAFDGPMTPTSGSRRAGLNGPGRGGSEPGSNPAPPDGGSGDGNSTNPGPAPAGFPAAFLASGGGARGDNSAQDQGEDSKPALPGGDSPAGPGKSRVTASGRVVAGGARLGPGLSGDPGTKGGSGQPGGSFGLGQNQVDGKADTARDGKSTRPGTEAPPIELALDGPTADPGVGTSLTDRGQTAGRGGLVGRPEPSTAPGQGPPTELALNGPIGDEPGELPPLGGPKPDEADPASTFFWPGGPGGDGKKRPKVVAPAEDSLSLPATNADRESQVAAGADPSIPSTDGGGAAETGGDPGGVGGNQAAQRMLGQPAHRSGQPAASASADSAPPPPGAMGIGLNAPVPPMNLTIPRHLPTPSIPPPGAIPPVPPMNLTIPRHLPTPSEAAAAVRRQTNAPPNLADWTPQGSVVDKTFEIVVVCGPDGVTVQPGNYRVTVDALKDREGLFKKQVVALVKNRRAVDPKTQVEPRVRFLIQPQGFDTYRLARSQFFVSGLSWPTSTQVAAPDPLVIRSRGIW